MHRVYASGMKRVALQQAAARKLQPTEHPILPDRNTRIFRTGRLEPAGLSKERRDPRAVTGKQGKAPMAHTKPRVDVRAVGAGAIAARLLSGRQRAAESTPV